MISHYIANATGELSRLIPLIEDGISEALPLITAELSADKIDIIFVSAAALAMPEYGIGGNSPGPNHIYVSLDPESDKITKKGLIETILHEAHHCMRWREPGYGETLGEAMISEGLACLYEAEYSGKPPAYAAIKLPGKQIDLAQKELDSSGYDHARWFFGSKDIDRWFGYTYGYKLCKRFAETKSIKAAQLVSTPADDILLQ